MTHENIDARENREIKRDSDNSIKTIVGVIVCVVMIVGWGISIGINYQRMNGIEYNQQQDRERIVKLEKLVSDGMGLRLQLQTEVGYIKTQMEKNGKKLDDIYDLINEHIRSDKTVMIKPNLEDFIQ